MSLLSSCLSNDDESQWTSYNYMPVTVVGDGALGYKFITDFDAVLVPVSSGLADLSWFKDVRRAYISFSLADENQELTLEAGKRYSIVLSTVNGMNVEIPSFTIGIDTLDIEYQMYGNDSIALKNKSVISINKDSSNPCYVQNGYLNITPSFAYDPYKMVYMLLYYDGEKDIDVANKQVSLNFYFNNDIQYPTSEITSFISMKIPENIYYQLSDGGMFPQDSLEVIFKVNTSNGLESVSCKTTMEDLLIPSY